MATLDRKIELNRAINDKKNYALSLILLYSLLVTHDFVSNNI